MIFDIQTKSRVGDIRTNSGTCPRRVCSRFELLQRGTKNHTVCSPDKMPRTQSVRSTTSLMSLRNASSESSELAGHRTYRMGIKMLAVVGRALSRTRHDCCSTSMSLLSLPNLRHLLNLRPFVHPARRFVFKPLRVATIVLCQGTRPFKTRSGRSSVMYMAELAYAD